MCAPGSSAPFATYEEAMAFLFRMVDYEKISSHKYSLADFDLSRTEALLASVGDPHRRLRTVHVAGTKGKGSTATAARALLSAAGFRTGLFTSPHLVHLEERVTVDGRMIPRDEVRRLLGMLRPYTERVRRESPRDSPTFFELVTSMAFCYFAEAATDYAVVEVGMGGRLDSTNVLHPLVAVITRVDYDHVRRLGPTLADIAREKAGIVKPGVPVVSAAQAPEVMCVIERTCADRGAPLHALGWDFEVADVQASFTGGGAECRFALHTPRATYRDLRVPLAGRHQAENAAVAVRAVELHSEREGWRIEADTVRRALAQMRIPGRIEIFPGPPLTILDGAHNPAAMRALRETIAEGLPDRRVIVVFAVAADKQVDEILREMAPFAERVIFTRSESPRALAPQALVARFGRVSKAEAEAIEPAAEALARARHLAHEDGVVCITGSLYLAGLLRPVLKPEDYEASG